MAGVDLTPEQLRAVTTLEGNVFVAAGAGSGKTGVLTRRFVHAIVTGYAGVDEILTITFTRKAAAEMLKRIREYLREQQTVLSAPTEAQLASMADAYRNIERARISTIDSFYTSVLRANALAAGIDPNFSAIDESQARLIQEEVFEACLMQLVQEEGAAAVEFITAYDPNLDGSLFKIVSMVYETLRSQGKKATLPFPRKQDVKKAEHELGLAVSAAREAYASLARTTATQASMMDKLAVIESALAATDPVERVSLAASVEFKAGQCGAIRQSLESVEEARRPFVTAARSGLAEKSLDLFRGLLRHFDDQYSREKHQRGVLDFADLSIHTRNLLRNEYVRDRVAARYKLIMVDEFQDTNPLQHEIIKMIAGENLFMVGDENQAIYGFRNAEVALFQREKEKARAGDYLIELKENFRSQRQILEFIDFIFDREDMLAPGYLKLRPAAPSESDEDTRVEVILIDERRNDKKLDLQQASGGTTRRAEAQMIASRLGQLFDDGYTPGDVAMLLKTGNDADIYRDALSRAGIESYFAIGSSYFGKLEPGDVINMFRLIVNPGDDLALIAVLRSPLAGLSDDALFWLRHSGPGAQSDDASLWSDLGREEVIERLGTRDREKLERFVNGMLELRRLSGRETLKNLTQAVINFGDYAAIIAAGSDGKQKLANLLKLVDLAADFELSWGNDIAELTDFLEHQKNIEAREVEAPTEEENVKAVRIMTMHGAKGLEFPLVVLPKLQARGKSGSPVLLIDRAGGDRIGLAYVSNSGADGKAFDYEILIEEERRRDQQELNRLGYVAMTRAGKHLILSGVAPVDREPNPGKKLQLPFDWLRRQLSLCWQRDENLGSTGCIEAITGNSIGLSICIDPEAAERDFIEAGRVREQVAPPAIEPDILRIPKPAIFVPPSVSPTALDTHQACPRRYFLENVIRAGDLFEVKVAGKAAAESGILSPTDMGLLIHKVLEEDLASLESGLPSAQLLDQRAFEALDKKEELSRADHERVLELLENFRRTEIATTLFRADAAGELRRELSFSTLVGQVILKGQIDALCLSAAATLVVDYKTGKPGENRTPEEAAGDYRLQMASYALAASRLNPGPPVRVVLLYLGGTGPQPVTREFSPADIPALEEEILAVINSMAPGDFPPLAAYNQHHCNWCVGGPNGAGLCPRAV